MHVLCAAGAQNEVAVQLIVQHVRDQLHKVRAPRQVWVKCGGGAVRQGVAGLLVDTYACYHWFEITPVLQKQLHTVTVGV